MHARIQPALRGTAPGVLGGEEGGENTVSQGVAAAAMAVTYKTAEEAYATRQRLWEARQQRVETSPVSDLDRFMFGKEPSAPHTHHHHLGSYSVPQARCQLPGRRAGRSCCCGCT